MQPSIRTVTAQPATTALTTVAAVKAVLGVTDTSQDAWFALLISRASSAIAAHCRRAFGTYSATEAFRPIGNAVVVLPEIGVYGAQPQRGAAPLILADRDTVAVASVVSDGNTLTVGTDYEVDPARGLVYRLSSASGMLTSWAASRLVTVAYSAGWHLPGDSSTNLPAAVEDACLSLVVTAHTAKGRDMSVQLDITEGVGRVAYFDRGATAAMTIDDGLADSLRPWKLYT